MVGGVPEPLGESKRDFREQPEEEASSAPLTIILARHENEARRRFGDRFSRELAV